MADRIGILGESTIASLGATTVYACPNAKGVKCRLMFSLQGNAAGGSIVEILVGNILVGLIEAMTASYYVFSTKGGGLRVVEQSGPPLGTTAALTVAPADPIYYLSPGDTIRYVVSGAALITMNMKVVGAEIDIV